MRRVVVALGVMVAVTASSPLRAGDPAPKATPRPSTPRATIGLAVAIATRDGVPVQSDAWVDAQIGEANRLFAPAGIAFRWTVQKPLAEKHVELHTRADRDALGSQTEAGTVTLFIVDVLEDVDEPGRLRMGVCWTNRVDQQRYIAMAATARPTVMAHELGHFFGNPHSRVTDNLMSYERSGGDVFLDDAQNARIRTTAAQFLATGRLFDVGPPRRLF